MVPGRIFGRLTPFTATILGIWVFSLVLRFWNLGQFNTLVFDEVYYAKFASQYWLGKPFFPSHPPLSHYLIALAMAIGGIFPVSPDQVNDLTGAVRSTWSYRWLNALTGSTIPLLLGAIAYLLTQRRILTVLVMGLTALDGLVLVESRYALNNIYLIFFGLIGQGLVLLYLRQRQLWQLILGGVALACAGSVKWNGFAFLLGIYLVWILAWGIEFWQCRRGVKKEQNLILNGQSLSLEHWRSLNIWQVGLWLGLVPVLVYSVIWIPHLLMNPDYRSLQGFWQIQVDTWNYHRQVGNSPDVHPYCSPWYSWLVMARPVAYYFDKKPPFGLVYDVHSMANPPLLWLSTIAMVASIWGLFWPRKLNPLNESQPGLETGGNRENLSDGGQNNLMIYLGVNYAVNLLPWLSVSRCTFFYHYLPAYLYSIVALAVFLETCLYRSTFPRAIALTVMFLVILGFGFWSPVFLGHPLTPQGFSLRMLFPSWI